MAPPDLTARPLGMSEVIDRSIALARRHLLPLFVAMLVAQAPALLLARQMPALSELLAATSDAGRAADLAARALRGLSWSFLALMALQLAATAAAAVIVAPTLDPRPVRPRPIRTLAAVSSVVVLQVVLLAAAPVAGMLPGLVLAFRAGSLATGLAGAVGALVGGVGLFLVVMIRLVLAPVVAALEGRAGVGALIRSARLMSPSAGSRLAERPGVRASLILFAALILALAVNGLAGLPRLVALRAQGGPGGLALLGAQLPLPIEIALTLFEAAASAALQPFSLVAVVVFYYDRRARTEALDLELWAGQLEEER